MSKLCTVKQPKAESGLSKQLLCNFQAENKCDRRQLEAEVKIGVACKKTCIWELSEMGAVKGHALSTYAKFSEKLTFLTP